MGAMNGRGYFLLNSSITCLSSSIEAIVAPNASSTRGFVVKAKPQRKIRRGACDC